MKYFTFEELTYSKQAEEAGLDNTPNEEEKQHLEEMIDTLLDPFREYMGCPVFTNSAFRNNEVNKLVKGSATSAHRYGYAIDIHVDGVPYKIVWQTLLDFCKDRDIQYDQIFTETDGKNFWVHVGYKGYGGAQRMQSGHWVKK